VGMGQKARAAWVSKPAILRGRARHDRLYYG